MVLWSYGPIPCLNDRLSPVNPIPCRPCLAVPCMDCPKSPKSGYFGSKRLFCKLLIVRGKVRVRHRAETTILLHDCNRLFWLLNGCTERLVRLQPAACWLNAFLPYLVGGHFGLIRCLTCCLLAAWTAAVRTCSHREAGKRLFYPCFSPVLVKIGYFISYWLSVP